MNWRRLTKIVILAMVVLAIGYDLLTFKEGGVETTIERRHKYAGDAHVDPALLRMSVGIEDVDDLWEDLSRALSIAPSPDSGPN